jgi:histidyl-tRNA synthetase
MQILSDNNVPFEVESKLVRGLDYYTRTTFEIISESVGAQSALCGGGRYNNLIEELGGKPTPGVGFAAGIERILLACQNEGLFQNEENGADIFIIKMNEKYSKFVFNLSEKLRANGYSVEMDYLNRSLKAQMREANKIKAKYAFLIGDEEYEKGIVKVKRMFDGMEKFVKISNIIEFKKIFEA